MNVLVTVLLSSTPFKFIPDFYENVFLVSCSAQLHVQAIIGNRACVTQRVTQRNEMFPRTSRRSSPSEAYREEFLPSPPASLVQVSNTEVPYPDMTWLARPPPYPLIPILGPPTHTRAAGTRYHTRLQEVFTQRR